MTEMHPNSSRIYRTPQRHFRSELWIPRGKQPGKRHQRLGMTQRDVQDCAIGPRSALVEVLTESLVHGGLESSVGDCHVAEVERCRVAAANERQEPAKALRRRVRN